MTKMNWSRILQTFLVFIILLTGNARLYSETELRPSGEFLIRGATRSGGLNAELQSRNRRESAGTGGLYLYSDTGFTFGGSVEASAEEEDDRNRYYSRSGWFRLNEALIRLKKEHGFLSARLSAGLFKADPVPGGFLYLGSGSGITWDLQAESKAHIFSVSPYAFCSQSAENIFAGGRPELCLTGFRFDYKYTDYRVSLFDFYSDFRNRPEKKIRYSGIQTEGQLYRFRWNLTGILSEGRFAPSRNDTAVNILKNAAVTGTDPENPLLIGSLAMSLLYPDTVKLRSGALYGSLVTGWGRRFLKPDNDCSVFQKERGICFRTPAFYSQEAEITGAVLRGDKNPDDKEQNGYVPLLYGASMFGGRSSILFTHPVPGNQNHGLYEDERTEAHKNTEHSGINAVSLRYGYTAKLTGTAFDARMNFADFGGASGAEVIFSVSSDYFKRYNLSLFASVTGAMFRPEKKENVIPVLNSGTLTSAGRKDRMYQAASAGLRLTF